MKHAFKFAVCIVSLQCAAEAHGVPPVRTVALSDNAVPGVPTDVTWAKFGRPPFDVPVINSAGQTAFRAFLTGNVDHNHDEGIWSEGRGSLQLVARAGDRPPGTSVGTMYNSMWRPSLTPSGTTLFSAFLRGVSTDITEAIISHSPTSNFLSLVAREGNVAPDEPHLGKFTDLPSVVYTAGEGIAFGAYVNGSDVVDPFDARIWEGKPNGLHIAFQRGGAAPGTPIPAYFNNFASFAVNAGGRIAFVAEIIETDTNGEYRYSIWTKDGENLRLVTLSGQQAPDTPQGVRFGYYLQSPQIDGSGRTAFIAPLSSESGVDRAIDYGIWSEASGSLRMIIREGDHAPGTPASVVFGWNDSHSAFSDLLMNTSGQMVFRSALTGPGVQYGNDEGIWLARSGSVELLARVGDQAPGMADGTIFGFIGATAINASGQVAFLAELSDAFHAQGLWATDRAGKPHLVIRDGDMLEVAAGDFRTIATLSFLGGSGNSDGRQSGLNDSGQLAFVASFTDYTQGVFVVELAGVPEPGSLLLSVCCFAALFRRLPKSLIDPR